tara:strand:+ start:3877 stop:4302 length:426 start_codon:yes stop_codon:yes gene_type:complete
MASYSKTQIKENMNNLKEIIKNIENMDLSVLDKLDLYMTINGGLTTDELRKSIEFHSFTNDSLEYIIKQVNSHRATYHGIGPFVERKGRWYNIRERKLDVIKKLTEENTRLKREITELKKKQKELEQIIEYREEFIQEHCA